MSEPAVPTDDERRFRRKLAVDCVQAVVNDAASPVLTAAFETIKASKPDGDMGSAVRDAVEGFDTELFGVAHELVMTRAEVEEVARAMIDLGDDGNCAAFGRRLLVILGVTP